MRDPKLSCSYIYEMKNWTHISPLRVITAGEYQKIPLDMIHYDNSLYKKKSDCGDSAKCHVYSFQLYTRGLEKWLLSGSVNPLDHCNLDMVYDTIYYLTTICLYCNLMAMIWLLVPKYQGPLRSHKIPLVNLHCIYLS